jgi:predicted O-methyltransferase YrrM
MEQGTKKFSFGHISNKIESFAMQKLHPDWPWWPKEAVLLCDKLLKATDIVLEFGSGRSTFWIATRCAGITSIEHNEDWYNIVKKKITQSNLGSKVKLIYAPITDDSMSEDQPYLLPVRDIANTSIDAVIVDGKLRAQAAVLSLPLLKPGGILIIDDAHRYLPKRGTKNVFPESKNQEIWKDIDLQTKDWRSMWTSDGIHATYFLIKP